MPIFIYVIEITLNVIWMVPRTPATMGYKHTTGVFSVRCSFKGHGNPALGSYNMAHSMINPNMQNILIVTDTCIAYS